MKQLLRAYAVGLLSATLIIGIYYLFFYEAEIQVVTETLSEDEMISALEASGHYIYEENPLDSIIDDEELNVEDGDDAEAMEEDLDAEEDELLDDDNQTDSENESLILTIEDGMMISEVAEILVEEEIIENRDDFASYLVENNYGTNIQIGEFELHQDMSLEEVVETIARPND